MTDPQHSPTPWNATKGSEGDITYADLVDAEGNSILGADKVTDQEWADMGHIVKCVNTMTNVQEMLTTTISANLKLTEDNQELREIALDVLAAVANEEPEKIPAIADRVVKVLKVDMPGHPNSGDKTDD